jgi:hypothetical protein
MQRVDSSPPGFGCTLEYDRHVHRCHDNERLHEELSPRKLPLELFHSDSTKSGLVAMGARAGVAI